MTTNKLFKKLSLPASLALGICLFASPKAFANPDHTYRLAFRDGNPTKNNDIGNHKKFHYLNPLITAVPYYKSSFKALELYLVKTPDNAEPKTSIATINSDEVNESTLHVCGQNKNLLYVQQLRCESGITLQNEKDILTIDKIINDINFYNSSIIQANNIMTDILDDNKKPSNHDKYIIETYQKLYNEISAHIAYISKSPYDYYNLSTYDTTDTNKNNIQIINNLTNDLFSEAKNFFNQNKKTDISHLEEKCENLNNFCEQLKDISNTVATFICKNAFNLKIVPYADNNYSFNVDTIKNDIKCFNSYISCANNISHNVENSKENANTSTYLDAFRKLYTEVYNHTNFICESSDNIYYQLINSTQNQANRNLIDTINKSLFDINSDFHSLFDKGPENLEVLTQDDLVNKCSKIREICNKLKSVSHLANALVLKNTFRFRITKEFPGIILYI